MASVKKMFVRTGYSIMWLNQVFQLSDILILLVSMESLYLKKIKHYVHLHANVWNIVVFQTYMNIADHGANITIAIWIHRNASTTFVGAKYLTLIVRQHSTYLAYMRPKCIIVYPQFHLRQFRIPDANAQLVTMWPTKFSTKLYGFMIALVVHT